MIKNTSSGVAFENEVGILLGWGAKEGGFVEGNNEEPEDGPMVARLQEVLTYTVTTRSTKCYSADIKQVIFCFTFLL